MTKDLLLKHGLVIRLPDAQAACDLADLIAFRDSSLQDVVDEGVFVRGEKGGLGFLVLPLLPDVLRKTFMAIKESFVRTRRGMAPLRGKEKLIQNFSRDTIGRVLAEIGRAEQAISDDPKIRALGRRPIRR